MLERFRRAQTRVLGPAGAWTAGRGVPPDVITWAGTLGVVVAALVCFPRAWLWQGALLVAAFSVLDMLDGHMARALPERDRRWGAFLDSSLDRVADAAVLGGLAWHLGVTAGAQWAAVAVAALVAAQLTSYVKARGEAVGVRVDSGVVARPDRLALAVLGALLAGLGVPWALEAAMVVLLLGGTFTVAQRMVEVRRQLS